LAEISSVATGAGECFNAGFLYGHLRGLPLDASLRCGNICGGLSTTARGGVAAPWAAQVEEWPLTIRLLVGFGEAQPPQLFLSGGCRAA
jgi:fructose-1-phosphate kinase PfkB-like protein